MKDVIFIILLIMLAYFIGYNRGIGNQKLGYGETGFPKNCRAIITENISGYQLNKFTAEDALKSIDRNCGEFGYSWDTR